MPRANRPTVVVIGSINTDFVCRTARLPRPGETVLGSDLSVNPGGKGANQAVAAARLGARVHMVGRVGDDAAGRRLRKGLRESGVDVRHVAVTPGVCSGCAIIVVDRDGQNTIVVSPGANARVWPADVDAALPLIRSAAVVVMQLEIPPATVRHALTVCRRLGVPTILDPAPVPPKGLSRPFYGATILTPNQPEAALLMGQSTRRSGRVGGPKRVARALLGRGASTVVLKLGARGSMLVGKTGEVLRAPAMRVRVVDSTAAGDAFTGALAVAMSEGLPRAEALRFANAAGALCCTRLGAQPALPGRAAVERLLLRRPTRR
jgi:ribokinase